VLGAAAGKLLPVGALIALVVLVGLPGQPAAGSAARVGGGGPVVWFDPRPLGPNPNTGSIDYFDLF
jgi:hypothetical protein